MYIQSNVNVLVHILQDERVAGEITVLKILQSCKECGNCIHSNMNCNIPTFFIKNLTNF
jgi:hypothetical protein